MVSSSLGFFCKHILSHIMCTLSHVHLLSRGLSYYKWSPPKSVSRTIHGTVDGSPRTIYGAVNSPPSTLLFEVTNVNSQLRIEIPY